MVATTVKSPPFGVAFTRYAGTLDWLPHWLPRLVRWGLVCWIVVFWRLGYPSLLDPDEAHYAELTREMLRARSWLVPLLDGMPFIDKPVLFHWMQGLAVRLMGETEFAIRLPSALAALGLFWTTRWVGVLLFGETVGEWGGLMFATIPITFALASVGLFDMVFACFLFGAVACLLAAMLRNRLRLQYLGYALLTLAVMTKGPVALLLVCLWLGVAALCSDTLRTAIRLLDWKRGLLMVTVASSPWFAWMWMHFGDRFVQGYLLAGNLWYVTRPVRAPSYMLYVWTFSAGFYPWSLVAVAGAIDAARRWRKGLHWSSEEALLWTWVVVVVGFFSVARFKVDRYILPAAPACCLLAACTWARASDPLEKIRNAAARWSVLMLGVSLVAIGVVTGAFMFRLDLDLSPAAALIPAAFLVGGGTLAISTVRRGFLAPPSIAALLVMLLVVYGTVVMAGFPVLERVRPTARIARALRTNLQPDDSVGLYRLERWRASLRYYLMQPVARLDNREAVVEFLARPPHSYVAMLRRDYKELKASGVKLRIVHTRPAVAGTVGWGLRRQRWDALLVTTRDP